MAGTARSSWPATPSAEAEVRDALGDLPVVVADNVVPRIGVLHPEPARRAIREMFLAHVIGGKHLSKRADFTSMVRGATPDLVLTGVEVLAAELGRDPSTGRGMRGVVVVDIGGATTDVHSVVELDPEDAGLSREVVASTPVTRTVEGDLGMRWSALSTWEAGRDAGLLGDDLRPAAVRRAAEPSLPAGDRRRAPGGRADRHDGSHPRDASPRGPLAGRGRPGQAGDGARVVERSGKDLREVDLLVGSGGVLRHLAPEAAHRILDALDRSVARGVAAAGAPEGRGRR